MTDKQVRRLFALGKVESGCWKLRRRKRIWINSAECRGLGRVPSELTPEKRWRTREDPFQEDVEEVRGLLEVNPGLEGKTILNVSSGVIAGDFPSGNCGRCSDG